MLFKLSNLNSNLALTLGYLNPALNNSAQRRGQTHKHNVPKVEVTVSLSVFTVNK